MISKSSSLGNAVVALRSSTAIARPVHSGHRKRVNLEIELACFSAFLTASNASSRRVRVNLWLAVAWGDNGVSVHIQLSSVKSTSR